MSYILDALKKSDQDRKQGEVPGLNSFQGQPKPPRSTSRIILYLLISALALNALVLGIWVLTRDPDIPKLTTDLPETKINEADKKPVALDKKATESVEIITETNPTTTASSPAEPVTKAEIESTETGLEQITDSGTATDITEYTGVDEEDAEEEAATPKLIKYNNLPPDVRSDLGNLNISAHYYANDQYSRMASINGRIMRQGQAVKSGVVLEEITRKGVIITFRNYRFSMDVFNH